MSKRIFWKHLPYMASIYFLSFLICTGYAQEDDSESILSGLMERLIAKVQMLVAMGTRFMLIVCRISYSLMVLVGAYLYLTHLNRHMGRDLVVGGLLLTMVAEVLWPILMH
ncbi:hypothetical protein KEJ26_02660 [Candidatus Bathyarchaeota archaeon]|nr:hypothetical protein [Candidatus Bathyarchaeota archaeon]